MADTKLRPGTRIMWRYGTKDYANYGEIGVVTDSDATHVTVTMDDEQPFHRALFGSKSKRAGHSRVVKFRHGEVELLSDAYRDTAKRMHSVAEGWAEAARSIDAYMDGSWCGECVFGMVSDPPCCAAPKPFGVAVGTKGAE